MLPATRKLAVEKLDDMFIEVSTGAYIRGCVGAF
jgi:hypothetical protein